jgi:hypothetical protein
MFIRAVVALVAMLAVRPAAAEPVLARYSFTPGAATFGLALPSGAARAGVRVGTLPTQTDIKVRWPDGSIRFAVVSARIPAAGTLPITAAPSATGGGAMYPAPRASVTLTIAGRSYTATLLAPSGNVWLGGPIVWEGRTTIAPGGHPFMRVLFDTRSYSTGGSRVDVTVENCLDVPGADQITYDIDIAIDGKPAFRQAGVTHKYLARWRRVFLADGLVESEITPDLSPFIAARAVPEYLGSVDAPDRALTGAGVSGTGYGPLAFGDLTVPMNSHSGRPEIAPYPDWAAQYLVHKKPAQRAHVLRHGELAGSWGVHVRNVDGTMPSIDADGKAYYWVDPRWEDPGNRSVGFTGPRGRLDRRAEPGDIAHQPSLAYIPYLVTGDRFFADEMAFWANFCLIGSFASDDARKGAEGLLLGNEVRGIGWALRNMGDAAAYLPDLDPMKPYLASKVLANLNALDKYAASFDSGPVQTLFPGRRPEDSMPQYQGYVWISLWEQSYVAWAIDHVIAHGSAAGCDLSTVGSQLRNRIARLQARLFTDPQWPKAADRQAPYLLAAGRWSGGPDRKPVFFQQLSEVASATFSVPSANQPDFVRPFEGYYGPEARLMLMIAARLGDRGAAANLQSLMGHATSGVRMIDDLNRRSGWAIAP